MMNTQWLSTDLPAPFNHTQVGNGLSLPAGKCKFNFAKEVTISEAIQRLNLYLNLNPERRQPNVNNLRVTSPKSTSDDKIDTVQTRKIDVNANLL